MPPSTKPGSLPTVFRRKEIELGEAVARRFERARQVARAAGRRICEREGAQFLDDTVAISRLRLQRNSRGRLVFYREYRFEYSLSGEERLRGSVNLLGKQVLRVEMGWQEF